MSEGFKFLASAGAVFTALAGLLWGLASKTEELLRDDVREGYAAWLKNTALDKPFRDWCYSFTYLYDIAFGIVSNDYRTSPPKMSHIAVFATICMVVIFVAFRQVPPALEAVDALLENRLYNNYPQFVRGVFTDLGLMVLIVAFLNIGAIYLSVLKTRFILYKFASKKSIVNRTCYVLMDILISLLIFAVVFQVAGILREISNSFAYRNVTTSFFNLPYLAPGDLKLVSKVADVYYRFLFPMQ